MELYTLRRRVALLAFEISFKAFLMNHSDSRPVYSSNLENKKTPTAVGTFSFSSWSLYGERGLKEYIGVFDRKYEWDL